MLYEFDVRFHTKVRGPICHVLSLLAVQNTHRRALLRPRLHYTVPPCVEMGPAELDEFLNG